MKRHTFRPVDGSVFEGNLDLITRIYPDTRKIVFADGSAIRLTQTEMERLLLVLDSETTDMY